jgi:DNA-binding NarL/FixJ family response regulator
MNPSPVAAQQLIGLSVLVVDDDYYQAVDTQETLERAGATVLGPCSNSDEAIHLAQDRHPSCAIVDLNLGAGPSFELARSLKALNIPLIIVSGYDAGVIPADLRSTPHLEKPVAGAVLIRSMAQFK